jgi:L-threonylcarbamoyladenylate synthase
MKPLIIKAASSLDAAVKAVREGGIIAYPTETFYGLGVDAFNTAAVERLVKLKARPGGKPISIIIKDACVLKTVVSEVPPAATELIRRFWPGPLTIVFKAVDRLPGALTGSNATIGVRVSAHPTAARLAAELSVPLTATSANPSGEEPPVTPEEVLSYFGKTLDVLIDGGRLPGRLASTVVDVTGAEAKILRAGAIDEHELTQR